MIIGIEQATRDVVVTARHRAFSSTNRDEIAVIAGVLYDYARMSASSEDVPFVLAAADEIRDRSRSSVLGQDDDDGTRTDDAPVDDDPLADAGYADQGYADQGYADADQGTGGADQGPDAAGPDSPPDAGGGGVSAPPPSDAVLENAAEDADRATAIIEAALRAFRAAAFGVSTATDARAAIAAGKRSLSLGQRALRAGKKSRSAQRAVASGRRAIAAGQAFTQSAVAATRKTAARGAIARAARSASRGGRAPRIRGTPLCGFWGLFEEDYGDPRTPEPYATITPARVGSSELLPFPCPKCGRPFDEVCCPERRTRYLDTQRGNYWCPGCGLRFRIDLRGAVTAPSVAPAKIVGSRTMIGAILGVLASRGADYRALARTAR